jgi:ribonuclease HII
VSEKLCGIDEAGRGPVSGPVCAAAVVLGDDFPLDILEDSKKLSTGKREQARLVIRKGAEVWGIGWVSAAEIDKINIHNASLLAMKRAFDALLLEAAFNNKTSAKDCRVIADGLFIPALPVPCEAMVKADTRVPAVMAASILAKTARDRLMEHYGFCYPQYGYEKHKGYPTKAHREAISRFGPSPIQRMSFNWRRLEQ